MPIEPVHLDLFGPFQGHWPPEKSIRPRNYEEIKNNSTPVHIGFLVIIKCLIRITYRNWSNNFGLTVLASLRYDISQEA